MQHYISGEALYELKICRLLRGWPAVHKQHKQQSSHCDSPILKGGAELGQDQAPGSTHSLPLPPPTHCSGLFSYHHKEAKHHQHLLVTAGSEHLCLPEEHAGIQSTGFGVPPLCITTVLWGREGLHSNRFAVQDT